MLERNQPKTALAAPFRGFNALAHSGVFGLPTSSARFAVKAITVGFCGKRAQRLPWRSHQYGESND
jgi:hypothetical protein